MTTEELEVLLEAARETASLDFKAPMSWSVQKLIKDFLAMANLQDGGTIVIGVSEDPSSPSGFRRDGLGTADASTYDPDVMKDQVDAFADPTIDFTVSAVKDRSDKTFVVLRVFTFAEQPVICKKDGSDVNAGLMYYRRTRGRPQSCRIDSAHDLRSILLVAHARMAAYLDRLGLRVTVSQTSLRTELDDELGGL